MEDERGTVEFEANRANLEMALRMLRRKRLIDGRTRLNFARRARDARTVKELRELGRDLARIVRSRRKEGPERDPG